MEYANRIFETIYHNRVIIMAVYAVLLDTVFGFGRCIKQHSLNSSFGINGAIRKILMIMCVLATVPIDMMLGINVIGFIPEGAMVYITEYTHITTIGMTEFFGILYICYEAVSILKNMYFCGLPVKRLWIAVYTFLSKYTDELPDTEGIIDKEK